MKGTIKELAKTYGLTDTQMNGAMHFLTKVGLADPIGEDDTVHPGRKSTIYKVNKSLRPLTKKDRNMELVV